MRDCDWLKLIALVLLFGHGLRGQSSILDRVVLEPIAEKVFSPSSISNAGDGSGRLFVTSQRGPIYVVDNGNVREEAFLDLSEKISCCSERGLLNLAFHPDYQSNGLFFVYYTDTNGDTVVARYRVSGDPNRADPDSELIVLTAEQPGRSHNGGGLAFGPDGYLYIGIGPGALTLGEVRDGALRTRAGGSRVFIDGVPAPIVFAAGRQIGAIVPFSVDGKGTASVEVELLRRAREAVEVEIVPAAPGIFSLDQSGTGQGGDS